MLVNLARSIGQYFVKGVVQIRTHITYNPNTHRRKRLLGFLRRLNTQGGRAILRRRRAKGRKWLSH